MFKIFTFKQLAIMSVCVCFIMVFGAFLNTASIYVSAFSVAEVTVPIIMYHQISENKSTWGEYVIPVSVLESDFEYMKNNNITPISLNDLLSYAEKGEKLPENPIVITFDDGERSFITKVLPLLEEYEFPANMNLIGSLVKLFTENGDTDDRYAYLNAEDVKKLSENPLISFGCHSYNFHSLSNRRGMGKVYGESEEDYKNLIEKDIKQFNESFQEITGQKTVIMAYPYGIRNSVLEDTVKDYGFKITLTCREIINKITVGGDLYNLGRFNRPYGKSSESFFEEIYK